jgi:aryl-alcohol dehydrogenase-like predicted oxidoreductase
MAGELALSPTVLPIPGASRPASITDSAQAAHLDLAPEELQALTAIPAAD